MYAQLVEKSKENRSRVETRAVGQRKQNRTFVDNRPSFKFVDKRNVDNVRFPPSITDKVSTSIKHDSRSSSVIQLAAQRRTLPIQAKWHYVQSGKKERKLNLKDNSDGTWSYTKTGDQFKDTGVKNAAGVSILQPTGVKSSPVSTTPTTHNQKNVLFGVMTSGKVEYLPNTQANREMNKGKFIEMEPDEFTTFKSGGKRSASYKMMDPVDLKRYAYDESNSLVYNWDSSKAEGRGTALSTKAPSTGGKSENMVMLDRIKNKELIDRRRKDRTNQDLQPFDVGTYKQKAQVPKEVTPLSGVKAWTSTGGDVNRDHVPSGESLKRRSDVAAYNQGITITIPNPEMHMKFSPTYGGKQQTGDEISGNKRKRVEIDTEYPQAAVYRDTKHMLANTRDQDYSSSHSMMNLKIYRNRLRQIGGYRKVFRLNTKLHKMFPKRGFDPMAEGWDFTYDGKKSFKYQKTGKKQGEMMSSLIEEELEQTKTAKRLS